MRTHRAGVHVHKSYLAVDMKKNCRVKDKNIRKARNICTQFRLKRPRVTDDDAELPPTKKINLTD